MKLYKVYYNGLYVGVQPAITEEKAVRLFINNNGTVFQNATPDQLKGQVVALEFDPVDK